MKSKDDKSKRRALKLNGPSRAYGTLRSSGSYAKISCIAQKENEPKAVSRDTVVFIYKGMSHRVRVKDNVTHKESRRIVIRMTHLGVTTVQSYKVLLSPDARMK